MFFAMRQLSSEALRVSQLLTLFVLFAGSSLGTIEGHASPPPFPDEMKYPNVVPPKRQFGKFGSQPGQLNEPRSVAISDAKEFFVVDTFNNRINVYDTDGEFRRSWGKIGTEPGQLRLPEGIAIAEDGVVYVSDTGNSRIQAFDQKGHFIRSWGRVGSGDGEFNQPTGVAVGPGLVAVADRANERIQLFTRDGIFIRGIGKLGDGQGEFNYPTDVAIDPASNIYVADAYNNRIQKFGSHGRFILEWGGWGSYAGLFATPSSVSFAAGRLYVGDLINHRIQVFDTNGKFLSQWGRHPPTGHEGNGRIHYPAKIAVTPAGDLSVVCEPIEYRCQVFESQRTGMVRNVDDKAWWDKAGRFHYGTRVKAASSILTIAEPDTHSVLVFNIQGERPQLLTRLGGQGRTLGSFVRPSGMLIDAQEGTILVSDGGNHRLQRFELSRLGPNTMDFAPNTSRVVIARSVVGIQLQRVSGQGFDGSSSSPVEPSALAKDKDGLIYMADPHNSRIVVLDQQLNPVRTVGRRGSGPGELLVPNDISFSRDGETLYVVDTYNFRIVAFNRTSGTHLFNWGKAGAGSADFIHPFGIASGKDGFVYVSDDAANRVQKFDERGNFVLAWGRWGTEPGQFYKPKGLAQDDRGRIIIADFGNHRAQIMSANGQYIDMFGIGEGYKPPSATTGDRRIAFSLGGIGEVSNGGTYVVNYEVEGGTPIRLNQPFTLRVKILQAQTRTTAQDVQLAVSATMPAHYHGMTTEPRVSRLPDGSFVVEGMLLHMPGFWQLNFDISSPGTPITERAQADIRL